MMLLVMMLVGLMTGCIDNNGCGGYDVDSDGDNDDNDADKDYYGDKNSTVLVMMIDVTMLIVMLKMVPEMVLMIKMILILKMTMRLRRIFEIQFFSIYHFLIQLDVNNLCSIKMYRVIDVYERNYDLAPGNICWFHLYRIFLGNYLPSRFYFFA